MMSTRKNLGDILLESDRITPEDVKRALEHQRAHGGYFGQALVALGIVRYEEVEWALASQFDLPFIFPDPDAIDREVARLVSADWALANLAVPIVRTDRTLRVVVENPLDTQAIQALQRETGLDVELALASPPQIRELIHALYGEEVADGADDERAPMPLGRFIAEAMDAGSARIGLSERDGSAIGWYHPGVRASGRPAVTRYRVRRRLADGWEDALEVAVQPAPSERRPVDGAGVARWAATMRRGSARVPIEALALVTPGGAEYVFHPLESSPSAPRTKYGAAVPPDIAADLRLLGRSGVRVAVTGPVPELVDSVLPRLASLIWGDDLHAVHLGTESESTAAFTLKPESAADPLLDTLAACSFDVLSVDLPADQYPLDRIFDASAIVFARLREPDRERRLKELGIRWIVEVDEQGWQLRPARDSMEQRNGADR